MLHILHSIHAREKRIEREIRARSLVRREEEDRGEVVRRTVPAGRRCRWLLILDFFG
jgi:hypothetical protein